MERDNFMSAEAALKFGLVDEVVTYRADQPSDKTAED
jgi:ATP-dependent protease ClpP protease subunit